jgi:single-strand DNA-binding protein
MSSVNKAIILGNLGKDPEKRYTQAGDAVVTLSVATSESWKDASGAKQERTEWHRITVWKAQAEACAKYLSKGSKVYVEGKIETKEWQDKGGQKRYTTEIRALVVHFLSAPAKRDEAPADDFGPPGGAGDWKPETAPSGPSGDDSDIPF